jgi:hypothetical protein
MMNECAYIRRKSIGMFHRLFNKYGQPSNCALVRDTVNLLTPRRYTGNILRIGGDTDGSYVMPDLLDGITASVSPGSGEEVKFDIEIGERGIHTFMYDASVSNPQGLNHMQTFEPYFLDSYTSRITRTLDTITRDVMRMYPGDLLLQMDIEGAEYRCLESASNKTLNAYRVVVIEFHDLDKFISNELYCKYWIQPILRKLKINHDVLHVHANNFGHISVVHDLEIPNLLELTLLRKDCWIDDGPMVTDCRLLDKVNRTDRPELVLHSPWFDYNK